ncbi:hypothetical protein GCM10027399_01610 [Curvibacter fontanus]
MPTIAPAWCENFETHGVKAFLAVPRRVASRRASPGAPNFALLKSEPAHPSLHFKTIGNGRYHSVRVGLYYRDRALGLPVPGGVHWFWIGTHGEYDKLIG